MQLLSNVNKMVGAGGPPLKWGFEIPSCAGQGHSDGQTKTSEVRDRTNAGTKAGD